MINKYYGFDEKPFSLTPDPDFFYFSKDHIDALEHLVFGITEGEGFLMLAGGIGTGKTTISRVLINKLGDSIVHSLILNPFHEFIDLLKNILWDLSVIPEGNGKSELVTQLNEYLINEVSLKGKTALIIIDEAQNLSVDTLEQLRILSNIETDKEKLLQILLLGQEELVQKLNLRQLRQLNQRITVRFYLSPLKKSEVGEYLEFRIKKANPKRDVKFTRSAVKEIYNFSKGVPRLINMIANRCLIAGFVSERESIDRKIVRRAKESLFGEKQKQIDKIKKMSFKSVKDLDEAFSVKEDL
jgi:general secretion pathway protein A